LKRQSGTKPSPKPPEPTFFTDRDLGKVFPRILRESGLRVERYADHFEERNVPDQEWIAFAARRQWVAISHDRNIKSDPLAIRTVMEEGARLFIVRGKHLTGPEKAQLVLDAQGTILRLLDQHREAFIATIRRLALPGGTFRADAAVSLTLQLWVQGQAAQNGMHAYHAYEEERVPIPEANGPEVPEGELSGQRTKNPSTHTMSLSASAGSKAPEV
jgi:hypothetical protein